VVRSELLGTRVFVFTEGGRILNLARGATLADAAAVLRVPLDSQSGFVCNHNMCEAVSLDSALSNGDIVCFAPSLDTAIDRSRLATASESDGGDQPLSTAEWGPHAAAATAATAAAAAAAASTNAPAAPAAPPLPGSTEVPPHWRAPSLLPISPLVPIAGLPLPTPISTSTSISPKEMALEDGCEIERATASWLSCEHCLPLPGDALTCTLHRSGGRVQGTVHRGGPDRRLRACKHLRRQLADGAQLLEGGEEMCGLLEQEATLTMALLTIAVLTMALLVLTYHGLLEQEATLTMALLTIAVLTMALLVLTYHGPPEQEASPLFGEGGSVGGRMLTTSLVAFVRDEPGALLALTQVATATSLSILDISSRSRSPSAAWPAMGAFEIRVRLNSLAQLEELTAALEQLPQVVSVRRDSIEMMLEESESSFWPDGVADPAQGQRPYL